MRITISGLACSGKDTIGELVANRLGLKLIKVTMKDISKEDILEFEKKLDTDKYDIEIDRYQKKLGEKEDNFVLVSRLSAINVPHAELKVWLYAPEEIRAKRISKRDKIPEEKALEYIKERDRTTLERIYKIYKIKFNDLNYYDLAINTGKFSPEKCVEIIENAVRKNDRTW